MAKFNKQSDYFLQAFRLHQGLSRTSNVEAQRLLREAMNPDLPRAYGLMSFTVQSAWLCNWISLDDANGLLDRAKDDLVGFQSGNDSVQNLMSLKSGDAFDDIVKAAILSYAEVALSLDKDDYDNYWSAGTARLYSGNPAGCFKAYQKAIDIAQANNAPATCLASLRVDYADALFFAGDETLSNDPADLQAAIERAIVMADTAMAENPNDPKHYRWNWTLGWAYYELAAYVDPEKNCALSLARLQQLRNPHQLILKNLIASYAACGMFEPAKALAGELLMASPGYTVAIERRWPYRLTPQLTRFQAHLRDANLPG
jgi:hypothetical protein